MNLPATITLRIDLHLTKDDEGKTAIVYADVSGAQPSSSFSGYQVFAPKLIGDLTLSPEHVVNKVSQRLLENIQDLLRLVSSLQLSWAEGRSHARRVAARRVVDGGAKKMIQVDDTGKISWTPSALARKDVEELTDLLEPLAAKGDTSNLWEHPVFTTWCEKMGLDERQRLLSMIPFQIQGWRAIAAWWKAYAG